MISHYVCTCKGRSYLFFILSKVRQATSRLGSIEKQLTDRTSQSGLHEAKLKELQEELESRTRRIGELEGTLEAKDIELKESASLVDRVKALHGEQCHELQRQIEEVRKGEICTLVLYFIKEI